MCKVDPNNIVMLRYVASVFFLCALISIVFGKTYCKRIIVRIDEPITFWSTVIGFFLLGTMMLLGTYICR